MTQIHKYSILRRPVVTEKSTLLQVPTWGCDIQGRNRGNARGGGCCRRNSKLGIKWPLKFPTGFFFCICLVASSNWECKATSNSGTFTRSNSCTIDDEVSVINTLEINGIANDLPVITAADGKRHFKITSSDIILKLKYLKLVGGDAKSSWNCLHLVVRRWFAIFFACVNDGT